MNASQGRGFVKSFCQIGSLQLLSHHWKDVSLNLFKVTHALSPPLYVSSWWLHVLFLTVNVYIPISQLAPPSPLPQPAPRKSTKLQSVAPNISPQNLISVTPWKASYFSISILLLLLLLLLVRKINCFFLSFPKLVPHSQTLHSQWSYKASLSLMRNQCRPLNEVLILALSLNAGDECQRRTPAFVSPLPTIFFIWSEVRLSYICRDFFFNKRFKDMERWDIEVSDILFMALVSVTFLQFQICHTCLLLRTLKEDMRRA